MVLEVRVVVCVCVCVGLYVCVNQRTPFQVFAWFPVAAAAAATRQ